ncbi:hypothetical protein A2U01_0018539, partial [Trifolium medium]|nr:hypothetical protein [Trifolium medium]
MLRTKSDDSNGETWVVTVEIEFRYGESQWAMEGSVLSGIAAGWQ